MPPRGGPRPRLRYPRPAAAGDIRPPNGGVDFVSAPEAMAPTSAQTLTDYLVDRPGKLIPRGPFVGAALGAGVDAVSVLPTPTSLLIGKKTATAGRVLFPWETHLGLINRKASAEVQLVRADPALRSVDLGSFAASDQTMVDIGLVPGPRQTVLNGLAYAISLDSAGELTGGDTVTLADGASKARKTELLSFDPSGASLPTFPNPSFDVDTSSWTPGTGTTITRDTAAGNFDTSPAAAFFTRSAAAASISTILSGTFKAGVTYSLPFKGKVSNGFALPTFTNPSFDTDTSGWTVAGPHGAISRDTANFDSTPASLVIVTDDGSFQGLTVSTVLSGTFKAGTKYTFSFKYKTAGRGLNDLVGTVAINGAEVKALFGAPTAFTAVTFDWTPTADVVNPTLAIQVNASFSEPVWIDTFALSQQPSVPLTVQATGQPAATVSVGAVGFTACNYTFTPGVDAVNPTLTITGPVLPSPAKIWVDTFTVSRSAVNKFGSNAPMAAQDVTTYLSRLFVLGGAAPGSAPASLTIKNSTLWWTDPGGPLTRVLAEWQDDVSGLVNQLQVGDDDLADPGVALARLEGILLVLKRHTLWAVRGTSPSNFTVRRIDNVGCLDPRSVVEYRGAVYWLSEQGFMVYDGATVRNLSRAIQPSLLAAADQSVGVGGVPGGTAIAYYLPNGYIRLSIGRRDTNTQLFDGLLHVPSGAWSTLTVGGQSGVLRAGAGGADTYMADGSTVWLCSGATHPERNPIAAQGATLPDSTLDSVITISGGTVAVGSSVKITPFWRSYMIPLSGPLFATTLQRYMQDYLWIDPAQTADDVSLGWHMSLKNSLGVELVAFDLGTQGTASLKKRRRAALDTFPEASSDVYLEVSVPLSAPAWTKAELYSALIEFQSAKPRLPE